MTIHNTSHARVSQVCWWDPRKEKSLLADVFVLQVCLQGKVWWQRQLFNSSFLELVGRIYMEGSILRSRTRIEVPDSIVKLGISRALGVICLDQNKEYGQRKFNWSHLGSDSIRP